jgi:hypothetical protein
VLLVGEGNFSFAEAKAKQLLLPARQMVASSFEDRAAVLSKYPTAAESLTKLESAGVAVYHRVDATCLGESLQSALDGGSSGQMLFDVVSFNFPCTDVHYAEEPEASVASNKELLRRFFASCATSSRGDHDSGHGVAVLAEGGEVRVTLRDCPPYTLWHVEEQAIAAGLTLHSQHPFNDCHYPEYSWVPTKQLAHILTKKRNRQAEKTTSTTYCFRRADSQR